MRKYKLQPVNNNGDISEEVEMECLSRTDANNVNMIQLVETVTVNVDTEDDEKDQSCNAQSRDWLC